MGSGDKLWSGRFSGAVDAFVDDFNASIDVDRRLFREDIRGSAAHARMLAAQGHLTEDELARIISGLRQIRHQIDAGEMVWRRALEDIHTHVEHRLAELIGPVAGKLHTARSRNDQVLLDFKLFLKQAVADSVEQILDLGQALIDSANANVDLVMPGYTHMQRAQPVSVAHHLHAYVTMLHHDAGRFFDLFERLDECPLGAGALAGTTLPIDRQMVSDELCFRKPSANSMATVGGRDFALEFLAAATICGTHLSRFSEELILWVSQEFQFAELDDKVCTGSSMMPQKKNPDLPELVRGKLGRMLGNFVALGATLKGLPLTYNKDLQEDKEPVFDSFDTLVRSLSALALCVRSLRFRAERLRNALVDGFVGATDLADYLVRKGVPFREAHHIVGQVVRHCLQQGTTLEGLPLEAYRQISTHFDQALFVAIDPQQMVAARRVYGGTSPDNVRSALADSQQQLDECRRHLAKWHDSRLVDLDEI